MFGKRRKKGEIALVVLNDHVPIRIVGLQAYFGIVRRDREPFRVVQDSANDVTNLGGLFGAEDTAAPREVEQCKAWHEDELVPER